MHLISIISAVACLLSTGQTAVSLDDKGYYASVRVNSVEILDTHRESPFVTLCTAGHIVKPTQLRVSKGKLIFSMEDTSQVVLRYTETPQCVVLEVVECPESADALLFGPLAVTINEVVGDIIGVVQGQGVAFGFQGLDAKTIAGLPLEYGTSVPQLFGYQGQEAVISVSTLPSYRLAATRTMEGAVYQFHVQNRSRQTFRKVQQITHSVVLPVEGPDALVKGARLAMFGCEASQALQRIGAIEMEQGLPHPLFDGEWGKTSRLAMQSYLISGFGEDDLDFVLEKAQRAGFRTIYHSDPFVTWGHFKGSPYFVKDGSDASIKRMVDKAAAVGVKVGVHTLSNFMTTNDPYVSPTPSKHLLKQAVLRLAEPLDAQATTLTLDARAFTMNGQPLRAAEPVQAVSYFEQMPMTLNALQIEDELITYRTYAMQENRLVLEGCTRGAFGTTAQAHTTTPPLYKLWDYPYSTLFPDLTLQDAFSQRLAQLFNDTGLRQISLDGLEGCMYTGQDDYATARFVTRWYQGLDNQENLINDASNLNHFTWHIATRMNWGEPWGEAMRTGQVANRIKNQDFFNRNLFPPMLGWFLIRLADKTFECTTLEDLEWALSESAGFDAGYSMSISVRTLRNHGQMDTLLAAIRHWDRLREAQAFPPELRVALKDPQTEWHLEARDAQTYALYPLTISAPFTCNLSELQPGQPGGSEWAWEVPEAGHYAFRLKVAGDGEVSNPAFATSQGTIQFPCTLSDGQYLLFDASGRAVITDDNYNVIEEVTPVGKALLEAGPSVISFSCRGSRDASSLVTVRFITRSTPYMLTLP